MRLGPFLIIGFVLILLWTGGFVVFPTAGFLIHLLVMVAVISVITHFFARPRTSRIYRGFVGQSLQVWCRYQRRLSYRFWLIVPRTEHISYGR